MKNLIDYSEKSRRKPCNNRERAAKRELCGVARGSFLFWHLVKTGFRRAARILNHVNEWHVYVGDNHFTLSTMQFMAMWDDVGEPAAKLFLAVTLKGKKAPNNKARTIRNLAPLCAKY